MQCRVQLPPVAPRLCPLVHCLPGPAANVRCAGEFGPDRLRNVLCSPCTVQAGMYCPRGSQTGAWLARRVVRYAPPGLWYTRTDATERSRKTAPFLPLGRGSVQMWGWCAPLASFALVALLTAPTAMSSPGTTALRAAPTSLAKSVPPASSALPLVLSLPAQAAQRRLGRTAHQDRSAQRYVPVMQTMFGSGTITCVL